MCPRLSRSARASRSASVSSRGSAKKRATSALFLPCWMRRKAQATAQAAAEWWSLTVCWARRASSSVTPAQCTSWPRQYSRWSKRARCRACCREGALISPLCSASCSWQWKGGRCSRAACTRCLMRPAQWCMMCYPCWRPTSCSSRPTAHLLQQKLLRVQRVICLGALVWTKQQSKPPWRFWRAMRSHASLRRPFCLSVCSVETSWVPPAAAAF
mmetsp:Transcript_25321/g.68802  ORF Transcript_25321/g.68802 Transcript_25321/m.68802 type:complete len:214 (-) Transcript_25321:988-1629(-)